jgi:hypothetical protein
MSELQGDWTQGGIALTTLTDADGLTISVSVWHTFWRFCQFWQVCSPWC